MINLRQYKILQHLDEFKRWDIEESKVQYEKILECLLYIQDRWTVSQVKTPRYDEKIITLISKMYLHCSTISHLLSGYEVKSKKLDKSAKVLDIVSMNILFRAQIETFLMFYFIYIQSESPDEIEFRYNNWIYAGYLNRKRFKPIQDKSKKQAEQDSAARAKLKLALEHSPIMTKFTENQKEDILNNEKPRLYHSWKPLIESVGIKRDLGENLYSRLSSNAHSEGMGMLNLQGTNLKYHKNHLHGFTLLFTSKLYLSLFLKKLIDYNGTARFIFDTVFSDLEDIINLNSSALLNTGNDN